MHLKWFVLILLLNHFALVLLYGWKWNQMSIYGYGVYKMMNTRMNFCVLVNVYM